MSKQKPRAWSKANYRDALLGGDGVAGIRSYVRGVEAKNGYNLHEFDTWTPAQKRKVRAAYDGVNALEAQEKFASRPRNPRTLKLLQATFHGDVKIPGLKVALIPWTAPKARPGAKRPAPKITIKKGVVAIDVGTYRREFVAFNPLALIDNTPAEVRRVFGELVRAPTYFIKVGEYQTLNAKGEPQLLAQVQKWMAQYDGEKALPARRGRRDNRPKAHGWWNWLDGVYAIKPAKGVSVSKAERLIVEGIKKQQATRRAVDKSRAKNIRTDQRRADKRAQAEAFRVELRAREAALDRKFAERLKQGLARMQKIESAKRAKKRK